MSNQLYGLGKEKFATAGVNYAAHVIKAYLVGSGYTPNFTTHEFVADLGANVLNVPQILTGKTYALGVIDAADVTFTAVTAGATGKAIVLARYITNDADSPLLAYIDTITGFPIATTGGDITIQWDNGSYKIWSF